MLHEVGLILAGPGQCCMGCRRPYMQLGTLHIHW